MIHYILQTIAFQLLFLVVYDLFLKKETFFNANRLYLLVTPILSLLLPFVQIPALKESIPEAYMIQLPTLVLGGETSGEALGQVTVGFTFLSLQNLWILGLVLSLVLFGFKLFRIFKLKGTGSVSRFPRFSIVKLPGTTTAFSFFRDIFLGENLSEVQQENILLHEKVHVTERHSWDLLFFEALRVLFWFNPLVYVFQKRMATLQEYIADKHVSTQKPPAEYYQDLLSQVFQTEKISFINTFFNRSLIKNRIVMLQKSKSKKIVQLKYLLLIPMVFGMLFYTSCSDGSDAENLKTDANLVSSNDTEVMTKITELSEAIMKKGNLTDEEMRALQFLATKAEPGDKVYESVHEYLEDTITEYIDNVPFAVIGKSPIYPGCENMDPKDAKKCTAQKIGQHVGNEFNTKLGNNLGLENRNRIMVKFKIDNTGNIVDVKARGPHPVLEAEAIRAVESLPKMIPGEHKGKQVAVMYGLPIIFELDE